MVEAWFALRQPGSLRAYARAGLLQGCWNRCREELDAGDDEEEVPEDADEDALKALSEGEFQLARQESIASLQEQYWRRGRERVQPGSGHLTDTLRAVQALEQLQTSLQLNVEANLAVERACLEIEGKL